MNIMPRVLKVEENKKVYIKYDEPQNLLRFNTEMDLIEEYLDSAKVLPLQRPTAKSLLCEIMTTKIATSIAYFKGRQWDLSEDEKASVLNEENLITLLLDKPGLLKDLKKMLETTYRKSLAAKEKEDTLELGIQ